MAALSNEDGGLRFRKENFNFMLIPGMAGETDRRSIWEKPERAASVALFGYQGEDPHQVKQLNSINAKFSTHGSGNDNIEEGTIVRQCRSRSSLRQDQVQMHT